MDTQLITVRDHPIWNVLFRVVLLLILMAQLGLGIYNQHVQSERRQACMTTSGMILAKYNSELISLLNGYQADAYDDPAIDRIAEQQLIAQEDTMVAISKQIRMTAEYMDLLVTCK